MCDAFKRKIAEAQRWADRLANADKIELVDQTDPGVIQMQDTMARVDKLYRQKWRERTAVKEAQHKLEAEFAKNFDEFQALRQDLDSKLAAIDGEMAKLRERVADFAAKFDLKAEFVTRPETGTIEPPPPDWKDDAQ